MIRRMTFFTVTFFGYAALLVFAHSVQAATLYIDPSEAEIHRGDTATVAVRIDTNEGECINTVDAVIHYGNAIRAVDVSRGDSILSIWVEDPIINEKERTIQFAGGIPGGYCGRVSGDPRLSNIIVELVFRSPGLTIGAGDNPKADITFDETTQVLLHDGLGTPAPLALGRAELSLLDTPGSSIEDDWNQRVRDDTVPPSEFTIALTRDDTAFSGQYYVVFSSLDKQSGIDHFEVIEESFEDFSFFSWGAATAPWREVRSPYVLEDQTLNSTIRIKAIDKAGNETVSTLIPDEVLRTISNRRFTAIAVTGVTIVIIIAGVVYALWRRKKEVEQLFENDDQRLE